MQDISSGSADRSGRRAMTTQRTRTVSLRSEELSSGSRSGRHKTLPAPVLWQENRKNRRNSKSGSLDIDSNFKSRPSNPMTSPFIDDRVPTTTKKSACTRNWEGMKTILIHPFSLLLLAFPAGLASGHLGWSPTVTFWLNFIALIPLAKILGDATEELDASLHNEVISGLLNATFGNAVEMIMTVQVLRAGLFSVVKETLLGSILSNMLLVLGMSFFFGGICDPGKSVSDDSASPSQQDVEDAGGYHFVREKEQHFGVGSTLVSVTMLLVSCLSFALPTVFTRAFKRQEDQVLQISRYASCIMIVSYCAYLLFQLVTHRQMLANQAEEDNDDEEEEEEEESDGLTACFSIFLLAFTTILVSTSSEYLVNVIEEVVSGSSLSESFIGVILLPVVGNACEHLAAVRFAVKNRPGLSVSIAVGSSTQVALFVVPFAVLTGWIMDKPMNLDFGTIDITVMLISVMVVLTIVVDGRSNWLEGYMLCSAYATIGLMYWFVHQKEESLMEL